MASERVTLDAAWLQSVGPELQPGDVIDGKYELRRLIGSGGMGAVVAARHVQLDEEVAVKVLRRELAESPDAVDRFVREARSAFRIRCENVTQIYDVGTTEAGLPYMAMELLDGRDLGVELERRGRLPLDEALRVFLQACTAVGEGHALGIVHRDLKPENLFLTKRRDGSTIVKILDFGLSKSLLKKTSSGRERSLTATSSAMGTPHYMSPEQWACAKTAGPSTDIWALGAMLYEMLAGRPPFDGDSIPEVYAQIVATAPPDMSETGAAVPAELEAVILRCLEKDAEVRFSSVGELMVALSPFAPPAVAASVTRVAGSFVHEPPPVEDEELDPLAQTVAMTEQEQRSQSAAELTAPALPERPLAGNTLGAWQQDSTRPPARHRWPLAVLGLAVAALSGGGLYVGLVGVPWSVQTEPASTIVAPPPEPAERSTPAEEVVPSAVPAPAPSPSSTVAAASSASAVPSTSPVPTTARRRVRPNPTAPSEAKPRRDEIEEAFDER
jgi:serine/threonine-protein kinase